MTNKKGFVVYIDHTVLNLLPRHFNDSDPAFDDWSASRTLWRKFREERIRLVTNGKDTEMDIILWFNRQGCCITDTLRAIEAINEFEAWNKVEKSYIQQYKQILAHFEELELLRIPTGGFEGHPTADEITRVLMLRAGEPDRENASEDDRSLLQKCLSGLGDWYTEDLWRDLKRTDYQLNWQILETVLARQGIAPVFQGSEGDRNRYLFGLLNRAVGLTKKSCGKLPVPDSHIDFVISMVLQKYCHNQLSSGINHLLNCIEQNINFYVTVNHRLIQDFDDQRAALKKYLKIANLDLNVMSPKRFVTETLSDDQRATGV